MLLSIKQFGDAVLRTPCAPVEKVDLELNTLAVNMLETMYAAEGIGLAAPQVGLGIRMVVIDIPESEEDDEEEQELVIANGKEVPMRSIMPLVFINPVLEPYGKQTLCQEGCLSVRNIRANVSRPSRVRATLPQLDGKVLELDCGGLLARCLQHECDHLDGFLFTDRVSSAAKVTLAKRLKNLLHFNSQQED
ncbi:MAG: peptide deformylase [Akkermansiaceae bacterium]|nr:peptide deformylase [Akkermansiaceae bacterium]